MKSSIKIKDVLSLIALVILNLITAAIAGVVGSLFLLVIIKGDMNDDDAMILFPVFIVAVLSALGTAVLFSENRKRLKAMFRK